MNLKTLSVKQLLSETKNLVAEERRVTLLLIEHLREIDRRLLFLEMGYGSLFEFCVKELTLSEAPVVFLRRKEKRSRKNA